MSVVVKVSLVVVGLCLFRVAAESGQQPQPQISKTTNALTRILLFKGTSKEHDDYVAVPFTNSVVLALMAEGAEGETKRALISVLGGELPDKNSYKELLTSMKKENSCNDKNRVVLENTLVVRKNRSVLDSFAELARDYYLTDVSTDKKSWNHIKMIRTAHDTSPTSADGHSDLPQIEFIPDAVSIYNKFSMNMKWPTDMWYHTSVSWDDKEIRAFGGDGNFAIGQIPSIDCTAIILPYKNTEYAMLVLLPKNNDTLLNQVIENFPEIEELKAAMTMKPAIVTVPCINIYKSYIFIEAFRWNTPFKTVFNYSADWSKLSSEKIYLDDVYQEVSVHMCVFGSTADSLNHYKLSKEVKPLRTYEESEESVIVDRPFVYVLFNNVNNIVYVVGKHEHPSWRDLEEYGDECDDEEIKV